MLSSTIKSTDLLSQPLNTDILKFLPIDVQQLVVRAISNNIIAHQRDVVENFPTDDHVKWVMEVIGTGFSLPFIDIDTISDCLTIYENWFDENEIPPTPIGEKREEYVNVAIGQLSLLFVRRDKQGVSAQIMIKYSDLCNRAFAFLMRLSELNYSTNTLRRIVCVVMAAVDDLCGPIDNLCNTLPMTKVIEHGIGNFYQLWGILSTQEKDMWDVLMSMHKKWVQVYEVASSWARMVNALQNTLMKCMFVEKTEEFNFQIHSNKTTITTTFNKKYGLYYYIKMVHMCGNPSNIIDSKVSAVVQQGFYDLIGMMIGLCDKPSSPDGNDLFDIFMDSLFHPIKYLDHNHYTDAVSCAIKSLTSIYQKLSDKTLYRKEYLVKVTKAIECGLLSNCLKVTECTIQSIHGLFNERAFEFNILLPSLLCAVTNCSTQSGTVERLSAIQLIHEFMPIIGKGRSSNIIPTLQKDTSISYEDVWSKLLYLTLQSFKNERNSDILKELIKIISKFIIDGAFSGGENVDTIFISISNLFVDNEYQLETLLGQSHEDLVDFLEIILSHSAICKDSPKSILSVFDFLLKFITKNVDNKQTRNLNSLYNVFSGYFIKCFDQLSLERLKMSCNVLNQVFSMLDSSRTEDSSSFFDFKLMNAIKQFALPITPLQTPIDEICLVNEFSQHTKYNYEEYIHIFQKEKSIFTFIELPWLQVNEEKSVILIIRNPYGKQCYHSKLRQNEMEWTLHEVTEEFEPFIKDVLPQHQVVWDSKSEFDISSVVNKLDKTLTECKRSSASLTKPTIINYQSLEKQQTISPSITCRMLINCLSYTDISNTLRVLPNTKQFLQSLQLLDSIPTKHIISVDIINQTKPTTEFVSFLDTLGTVIQTNDKEQKLAFDESFFRIEFNSPLLKTTEKKMSSQVQLYWNEPLQQTDEFNISIIPTVSDLFVVSTNCPSSTLEQTQLVHLSTLGPLIREAIISYSRRTTEPLKPLKNRQNVIEELVTKRNACLPFVDTAFSNATIESLNNIGFKQLEVFSKTTTTTSDQVGQSDGNSTHPDGLGQTKPSGKIIRTSQIITQTKLNGEEEGESVVTATPTKMSDSSNLQSPNSEKKKKLGFFRRSTSKK